MYLWLRVQSLVDVVSELVWRELSQGGWRYLTSLSTFSLIFPAIDIICGKRMSFL
jgi:hypothetical protein